MTPPTRSRAWLAPLVAAIPALVGGGALAQGEAAQPKEGTPTKPAEEAASRPGAARRGRPTRPAPAGAALAIEGVRVLRPGQEPLEKGTILVRGRRIVAVGAKVAIPDSARRIDGAGLTATAGWIDARGTTPLDPESANDGAPSADRRAIDGLDPVDPEGRVRAAADSGVVACFAVAGRGLLAGTGALFYLRPGEREAERLVVDGGEAIAFVGGSARSFSTVARVNDWANLRRQLREAQKYRETLDQYQEDLAKFLEERKKGAKPAAPKGAESAPRPQDGGGAGPPVPVPGRRRPPRTREEAEYLILCRALGIPPVVESRDGGFFLDDGGADPALADEEDSCGCCVPGPHSTHPPGGDVPVYAFQEPAKPAPKTVERPRKPDLNPNYDGLLPALRREMPVRFEARRADEIRAAIAIAAEFRLRAVLEGCDEAGLLLDEIAAARLPVVLAPVRDLNEAAGFERWGALASELARRQIPFAIGSGRGTYGTAWLRAQVAMAVAAGLPRDAALAAVTSGAASILGVDAELGALEPGRDANVVLFDGDPFDPTTPVKLSLVEGEVVLQR